LRAVRRVDREKIRGRKDQIHNKNSKKKEKKRSYSTKKNAIAHDRSLRKVSGERQKIPGQGWEIGWENFPCCDDNPSFAKTLKATSSTRESQAKNEEGKRDALCPSAAVRKQGAGGGGNRETGNGKVPC